MKSSLSSHSKRILSIVSVLLLLIAVFLVKSFKPGGNIEIIDPNVPLANLSSAYFVVAQPDVELDDIYSLTDDCFDFIGTGTVLYESDIYNDSYEMKNAVQSAPDINDFVTEGTTIEWRFLLQMEDSLVVVGVYTEDISSSGLSPDSLVNAEYYLFNPQMIKATFTNVTPNLCEYIGSGTAYYLEDLYNSPNEIASLISDVPNYEAPEGKEIEWGSLYEYNEEYIVVGRYITASQSSDDVVPADDPIDDNNNMTLQDLLHADLEADTTVYTTGFYYENDGGEACYYITNKASKPDGMMTIAMDNGLYAVLQVEDGTICVDQLGAHGDGESDDVTYIQKAFDSGYNVIFGKEKTYKLISDGVYIRKNIEINGNHSTLYVDDSYAPTRGDFEKRILRCSYYALDSLKMYDINFDVRMYEDRFLGDTDYLVVFQPKFIKDIDLQNVDIYIDGGKNVITNFWMDNGCDNLYLSDCDFENYTDNQGGGLVFLNSRDDQFFDYFAAFKNVQMTNCVFKGNCGDEAIALWGPNYFDVTFDTCTVDWRRQCTIHSSRPIAIYCGDAPVEYNVTFNTCTIISDSPYADSAIGVGSSHSPKININFYKCDIYANVKNTLLYFQLLPSHSSNLTEFDFNADTYNINFDTCDIVCNQSITGSNKWYNSTTGSSWPLDCTFYNCDIKCSYCFASFDRYSSTKYYYVPKISIDTCEIEIDNALGVFLKSTYSAHADLSLTNTHIKAPDASSITAYRYKMTLEAGATQAGFEAPQTNISNTTLNGVLATK